MSFRDLLIGQAVSSLSDWMGTVALMALVLQLTDSATAVGGVLVLLALTVSGRTAGRSTEHPLELVSDHAGHGRGPHPLAISVITRLWWIYLWAFVVELAGMVSCRPGATSIPDLVDGDDDLATARAGPRHLVRHDPGRGGVLRTGDRPGRWRRRR